MLNFFFLFLIFLIKLDFIKSDLTCKCQIGVLEELDKLNKDYKRLRIEKSDGLKKFSRYDLLYNSFVECNSIAVYKTNENQKKCRICILNGWSELKTCEINRCDKDSLTGDFGLETFDSKLIDQHQQNLFIPGHVLAIYDISPFKKTCKICQYDGEWSKMSLTDFCRPLKPKFKSIFQCKYSDLINFEFRQLEYVRLHIESSNGSKIRPHEIMDNKLPEKTIIVYQRYLSALSSIYKYSPDSSASINSFTKKFCRYCENGIWSEIESCSVLNCDKDLLTGNPQLVLIDKSLKLNEQQTFFQPNSVLAVYFFGSDKLCKQCNQNGEWSKYSLKELCKIDSNNLINKYDFNNRDERDLEELYKKEDICILDSLKQIESEADLELERLYFVSSDRKFKLNPEPDARIPSRSLSIYINKYDSNRTYCSICINGIWSKISEKCTTDSSLNFCEKEKLQDSPVLKTYESKLVPEHQNLFEPGSVIVIYELTENTKLCKICEQKNNTAEWSKYAESSLCKQVQNKPKKRIQNTDKSCLLKDLELIEQNELFTRENILNWNAKKVILDNDLIEEYSMAVYISRISTDILKSNFRWCRKCYENKWEINLTLCPIEFSINKCDLKQVLGVNYFVYASDGTRLNEDEKNYLVFPGKVIAVYEFGFQKYCKTCNEDGNWSSYPQYQLCNLVNWMF